MRGSELLLQMEKLSPNRTLGNFRHPTAPLFSESASYDVLICGSSSLTAYGTQARRDDLTEIGMLEVGVVRWCCDLARAGPLVFIGGQGFLEVGFGEGQGGPRHAHHCVRSRPHAASPQPNLPRRECRCVAASTTKTITSIRCPCQPLTFSSSPRLCISTIGLFAQTKCISCKQS